MTNTVTRKIQKIKLKKKHFSKHIQQIYVQGKKFYKTTKE